MECALFSLDDFIKMRRKTRHPSEELEIEESLPPFRRARRNIMGRICDLWTIGKHIVLGLEFLHQQKYVHRDVKPGNGSRWIAPY